MAIGLGRMFGFRLPRTSTGPTRRSRSPTSGAAGTCRCRAGSATTSTSRWAATAAAPAPPTATSIVVFLLAGLWHGASWTFVVWGAYHGDAARDRARDRLAQPPGPTPAGGSPHARLRPRGDRLGAVPGRRPVPGRGLPQGDVHASTSARCRIGIALAATNQATVTMALAALVVLMPRDWVTGRWLDEARTRLATGGRFAVSGVGGPLRRAARCGGDLQPLPVLPVLSRAPTAHNHRARAARRGLLLRPGARLAHGRSGAVDREPPVGELPVARRGLRHLRPADGLDRRPSTAALGSGSLEHTADRAESSRRRRAALPAPGRSGVGQNARPGRAGEAGRPRQPGCRTGGQGRGRDSVHVRRVHARMRPGAADGHG